MKTITMGKPYHNEKHMAVENNNIPECFGEIDNVFPKAEDGLRHTPEPCFCCSHKTACLSTAIKEGKGMDVQEEMVDRAYESGMINFFERWIRKKSLRVQNTKK